MGNHFWQPTFFRALLLVVFIVIGSACSVSDQPISQSVADADGPKVVISSPVSGETLVSGQTVKIVSNSDDDRGLTRVELFVNGQLIRIDANPQPEPNAPYIVAQPWTPEIPGSYVVQVWSYNTANVAGKSEPLSVEVALSAQAVQETMSTTTVKSTALIPPPTLTITPSSTPKPSPTSMSTRSPASPTFTSPPGTEPTPVPLIFSPTGFEPEGRFREVWLALGDGESRLGHPVAPEIVDRDFAQQYFERGLLYWWDNPAGADFIWVIDDPEAAFKSGGNWSRYVDTWDGGDDYSCEQARENGDKGPIRGFGKLWCEQGGVSARLGDPVELELGSGGNAPLSVVQFYQGGVMLYNPMRSEVFVLFNGGDWQRFQ
jgi:hypothetical protein